MFLTGITNSKTEDVDITSKSPIVNRMGSAKYDPAERRARYLASKSNPEKLERHRLKNRKWASDFRSRIYADPQKLAEFRSKQQWERIKRRIEEDGDVIGADEFRTPDGLIYYAVAMMVLIQHGPKVRAEKKRMRNRLKAHRDKHRKKDPEYRSKKRLSFGSPSRGSGKSVEHQRVLNALRSRLCVAVKIAGAKKCQRTIELLGCSFEQLKHHLESKFEPGMTWENYGRKHGIQCWEVDHILPCASFDLTDPEQQKKCFHFSNLQPLWGVKNRMKSDRVQPASSPLTPPSAVAT